MTQEEKQLLIKDLCARLPYDVKGRVYAETTKGEYDINGDMIFFDSPFDVTLDDINTSTEEIHVVAIGNEDTVDFIEDQQINGQLYTVDEFKPYLRSMSSMTEEERKELSQISEEYLDDWPTADSNLLKWNLDAKVSSMRATFYNSHHLDWNGLIEKGIALEAPNDMYKNE